MQNDAIRAGNWGQFGHHCNVRMTVLVVALLLAEQSILFPDA